MNRQMVLVAVNGSAVRRQAVPMARQMAHGAAIGLAVHRRVAPMARRTTVLLTDRQRVPALVDPRSATFFRRLLATNSV
jgi:hypothetical protein